jgi:maleylpyruvate isomerase
MILYGYGLSSASFRVRIALALKSVDYTPMIKNLRLGEHRLDEFLTLNPQGFVPALGLDDGTILTQSVAILEYLDELYPDPPLLPADPVARARVRGLSHSITSDVHPLNNLRVLRYLEEKLVLDKETRDAWYRYWIQVGFDAFERALANDSASGRYCHGDSVTMADLCLVPQVFNARRYSADLYPYPRIVAIDAACRELPAFQSAAPVKSG